MSEGEQDRVVGEFGDHVHAAGRAAGAGTAATGNADPQVVQPRGHVPGQRHHDLAVVVVLGRDVFLELDVAGDGRRSDLSGQSNRIDRGVEAQETGPKRPARAADGLLVEPGKPEAVDDRIGLASQVNRRSPPGLSGSDLY